MKSLLHVISAVTVAVLLVAGSTLSPDAAPRARNAPTTAFDGLWSVSIVTYQGDCNRGYRYPLRIWEGRVLKADNDPNYNIAGAVARNGAIGVSVAGNGQTASATGRLRGNYGAGVWQTSNGECSGRWTAERRG
ncbi:MAG: hypothetical protein ACRECE_01005 [Xanthobacteraceae bacterium]